MNALKQQIENAFDTIDQTSSTPATMSSDLQQSITEVIDLLDSGQIRVAEKYHHQWITNEWIKKAILLFFKMQSSDLMNASFTQFFDKVPAKFQHQTQSQFEKQGVRIVPPAYARKGAYIAPKTVLMPSFINIGAYIDSETLIDTWATIGSCAQIGKRVHISGGVGIGGVLEPLQNQPTIIEDDCFIGARSEIVEGVIVEKGAVISMGVFIGKSTPIYNRHTDEITYGRIPENAVVVSGNLPAANGKYARYCAIIMKQVDQKTREKTAINDLLRE